MLFRSTSILVFWNDKLVQALFIHFLPHTWNQPDLQDQEALVSWNNISRPQSKICYYYRSFLPVSSICTFSSSSIFNLFSLFRLQLLTTSLIVFICFYILSSLDFMSKFFLSFFILNSFISFLCFANSNLCCYFMSYILFCSLCILACF